MLYDASNRDWSVQHTKATAAKQLLDWMLCCSFVVLDEHERTKRITIDMKRNTWTSLQLQEIHFDIASCFEMGVATEVRPFLPPEILGSPSVESALQRCSTGR